MATRPSVTINKLRLKRSATFELVIPRLSIRAGRVLCIVGANGSGKTTLLEIITNIYSPKVGTVNIFGHAYDGSNIHLKRSVGYVPDDDSWIIPELTASEFFALQ